MGNCLFGGLGDDVNHDHHVTKVITSNGGVMEFYAPITVECITEEFQGHGIFRSHDLFWKPLGHHEVLVGGESYYLLPLNTNNNTTSIGGQINQIAQVGHIRSNSVPQSSLVVPYRMSFDMSTTQSQGHHHGTLRRSYTEVFSRPCSRGRGRGRGKGRGRGRGSTCGSVWKVKLVISPEQLLEILSQDGRTQELIESVRTVAKCGNGLSSLGFTDQWSLSSSRNASSSKDAQSEI